MSRRASHATGGRNPAITGDFADQLRADIRHNLTHRTLPILAALGTAALTSVLIAVNTGNHTSYVPGCGIVAEEYMTSSGMHHDTAYGLADAVDKAIGANGYGQTQVELGIIANTAGNPSDLGALAAGEVLNLPKDQCTKELFKSPIGGQVVPADLHR